MKTTRRLLILFVLALLAIPTFAVLAKELGWLTISGPGIKGELTIEDPKELAVLWQAGIIDTNGPVKPPADLGEGYTITAYMTEGEGSKLLPFVQMVYYPARPGEAGYVHIVGRLDKVSMSKVDQWTRMNPGADKALRSVMTGHGIVLQTAVPAVAAPEAAAAQSEAQAIEAAPMTASTPAPAEYGGWIAIVVALGAVVLLGVRRSVVNRSRA